MCVIVFDKIPAAQHLRVILHPAHVHCDRVGARNSMFDAIVFATVPAPGRLQTPVDRGLCSCQDAAGSCGMSQIANSEDAARGRLMQDLAEKKIHQARLNPDSSKSIVTRPRGDIAAGIACHVSSCVSA